MKKLFFIKKKIEIPSYEFFLLLLERSVASNNIQLVK